MSGNLDSDSTPENTKTAADDSPPVDLPPVTPPSAGFIIQLFVVPGLIVLVVVGVWALFGKLAAGEQDWKSLVAELGNSNEHRRWRGAHGLAQMLQADQELQSDKPGLSQNPVVIGELTKLFEKELARTAPSEDDVQFQAFLARTMGLLESQKKVVPVLREAMRPDHDREVRKNAVAAVAVIADRAYRRGSSLKNEALLDDVIEISRDTDPLMRQVAAFTLGLVDYSPARDRLLVLLDDSDQNTRLNAAIALSRDGSTDGLRVFADVLSASTEPFQPANIALTDPVKQQEEINSRRYQRSIRLRNTLQALEKLEDNLTQDDVKKFANLLAKVSKSDLVEKQFRQRADIVRKQLVGVK